MVCLLMKCESAGLWITGRGKGINNNGTFNAKGLD
jgi:hypothetical protein